MNIDQYIVLMGNIFENFRFDRRGLARTSNWYSIINKFYYQYHKKLIIKRLVTKKLSVKYFGKVDIRSFVLVLILWLVKLEIIGQLHLILNLVLFQLIKYDLISQIFNEVVRQIVPVIGWIMTRRKYQWIQTQPQRMFDHRWYYPWHQRAVYLQTWVGIDLYQPYFELLIDHKI